MTDYRWWLSVSSAVALLLLLFLYLTGWVGHSGRNSVILQKKGLFRFLISRGLKWWNNPVITLALTAWKLKQLVNILCLQSIDNYYKHRLDHKEHHDGWQPPLRFYFVMKFSLHNKRIHDPASDRDTWMRRGTACEIEISFCLHPPLGKCLISQSKTNHQSKTSNHEFVGLLLGLDAVFGQVFLMLRHESQMMLYFHIFICPWHTLFLSTESLLVCVCCCCFSSPWTFNICFFFLVWNIFRSINMFQISDNHFNRECLKSTLSAC